MVKGMVSLLSQRIRVQFLEPTRIYNSVPGGPVSSSDLGMCRYRRGVHRYMQEKYSVVLVAFLLYDKAP